MCTLAAHNQDPYNYTEGAHACWTKEEMEALTEGVAKAKAAITELIQLGKAALTKLSSCIKQADKELEQQKQKDGSAKKRQKKDKECSKKAGLVLHDVGFSSASPLKVVGLPAMSSFDFCARTPFVISVDAKHEAMAADSVFRKTVDMFVPKFEQSQKERLSKGVKTTGDLRAQRAVGAKERDEAVKFFDELLGSGCGLRVPTEEIPDEPEGSLAPAALGIEKDYMQASSEKEHLATLRMSFFGHRSVVIADTVTLSEFHRATKVTGSDTTTLKQLQRAFRNFSVDDVRAYTRKSRKGNLWAGTVAPGDAIFLPAGCTISEVVSPDADHYGLRMGVVLRGDVAQLAKLSEELLLLSGQSTPISAHVEKLCAIEGTLPSVPDRQAAVALSDLGASPAKEALPEAGPKAAADGLGASPGSPAKEVLPEAGSKAAADGLGGGKVDEDIAKPSAALASEMLEAEPEAESAK